MKQITAAEFKRAVARDPAWAANLTERIEIAGYCNLKNSHITNLSPMLIFKGRSKDGWAACFTACRRLKVAEGVYDGFVTFSESGIQRIGDLRIMRALPNGWAASFFSCEHLKSATGSFPGAVDFSESGVEVVESLHVTGSYTDGMAASFENCQHLRIASGRYAGWVDFSDSGLEKFGGIEFCNEEDRRADVHRCAKLKVSTLPRNLSGWGLDEMQKLQLKVEAKARQALREPNIEL